jgi:hypothetical protein
MHHLSPVDELAEIRAEIARLKQREAALRDTILTAPSTSLTGRWHRVEVTEHRVRMFDPALLPDVIRDNPAYWRERVQTRVSTLALQTRLPRPGWPIRRGDDHAAMH